MHFPPKQDLIFLKVICYSVIIFTTETFAAHLALFNSNKTNLYLTHERIASIVLIWNNAY